MYNYVRSRQLEGTFPGSAETGTWIVTSMRVSKGWGMPPEGAWPYDGRRWPPGPEPPGIDTVAKRHQLFAYGRVRSIDECRRLLASELAFTAALEIDNSWAASPDGQIAEAGEHESSGSHSVYFVGYDDATARLSFANSWGTEWGDRGYGSLSYAYFEQRLLEAWYPDLDRPAPRDQRQQTGMVIRIVGVHDPLGQVMHVVEEIDLTADEIAGWALAVEIDNLLDIEELFVRPGYRGRGHGRELAAEISRIAARQQLACRLWLAHADWTGAPTPAQSAILASLGLTAVPCTERWASAVAVQAPSDPGKAVGP
jgi:GNAT superfamily N-acetyltransferase